MTWQLLSGDCVAGMKAMEAGSIDLVFADPPFNIGYEYDEYNDAKTDDDYLQWSSSWLCEAKRVLKPDGTFWLAIGDTYASNLDMMCRQALGFHRRSWVVWHYTFGVNCKRKFTPSHTHLFHYVVNPKAFTFNADAIKVPSARQAKYGDKRAAAGGRLPDDTWQFSRVCGTFKERVEHPCQMPEAVLDRIIRVSSNPGDLVLDPFAGSGTTLAVAEKLGRRSRGFEISEKYSQVIADRMAAIAKETTECPAASQSLQTACS